MKSCMFTDVMLLVKEGKKQEKRGLRLSAIIRGASWCDSTDQSGILRPYGVYFETVSLRLCAIFDSWWALTYSSTAMSCCMTTAVPACTEFLCLTIFNVLRQLGYATVSRQGHVICYRTQLGADICIP